MKLSVHVLGPMSVRLDGQDLPLPGSRKTRALLAYLLICNRPVSRTRLCDLFFSNTNDPRAALRWTLSKLREVIEADGRARVHTGQDTVAISKDHLEADALTVLEAGDSVDSLSDAELDAAIAAAGGGVLLEGSDPHLTPEFTAWLAATREDLRSVEARLLRLRLKRTGGDPETNLADWRRLVSNDPLSEEGYVGLAEALAQAGRLREAERVIESAVREFRYSGLDPAKLRRRLRAAPVQAPSETPPATVGLESWLRVAILPFANRTADPALDQQLEVFLDESIHGLSRFHGLRLASFEAVAPFKGRIEDPREIGQQLGADYLVGGSVSHSRDRLDVRYRVVEARTGEVLSSGDFDVVVGQGVASANEAADSLILHCAYHLTQVARLNAKATPPAQRRPIDHYLVGLNAAFLDEPRDYAAALAAFESAMTAEPAFGRAAAYAAFVATQMPIPSAEARQAILARARHAISVGSADAEALAIGAWTLVHIGGDFEAAIPAVDRAVRLNPLSRVAWTSGAWIRALGGEFEEPMRHWEVAERLNPFRMGIDQTFAGRALCCFLARKLDLARQWAKACLDHAPSNPAGHAVAVAAAVEAGDRPGAAAAARALLDHFADGAKTPAIRSLPLRQADQKQRLIAALDEGIGLADGDRLTPHLQAAEI